MTTVDLVLYSLYHLLIPLLPLLSRRSFALSVFYLLSVRIDRLGTDFVCLVSKPFALLHPFRGLCNMRRALTLFIANVPSPRLHARNNLLTYCNILHIRISWHNMKCYMSGYPETMWNTICQDILTHFKILHDYALTQQKSHIKIYKHRFNRHNGIGNDWQEYVYAVLCQDVLYILT